MLGQIITYLLYVLCFFTITTAIAGLLLARHARKGGTANLEQPLVLLSMIAATAPYIGLFGTVWHIIQALSGIGAGNLNVAAIAQPIGQALYATLWGLGCAIPALVAHRLMLLIAPDETADEAPLTTQEAA